MNSFWVGVFAGVGGGLITSVVLLFAGQWWRNTFLPWFEDVTRKGARIDGVWRTSMKIGDVETSEVATLTQRGHLITGTIVYPEDTKGNSHFYSIKGEFFDNIFTALMVEEGKTRMDRGAMLLTLEPGTSHPKMNGIGLWFYDNKPYTSIYKWTLEQD